MPEVGLAVLLPGQWHTCRLLHSLYSQHNTHVSFLDSPFNKLLPGQRHARCLLHSFYSQHNTHVSFLVSPFNKLLPRQWPACCLLHSLYSQHNTTFPSWTRPLTNSRLPISSLFTSFVQDTSMLRTCSTFLVTFAHTHAVRFHPRRPLHKNLPGEQQSRFFASLALFTNTNSMKD